MNRCCASAVLALLLAAANTAANPDAAQIPPVASGQQAPGLPDNIADIQNDTEATGENWPLYGGNHKSWRYSALDQIKPDNVANLRVAWTLETGTHDAFECSPIVVNGVMYITTPWNHVFAVDAANGKTYWHFVWPLPESLPLCCGAVNRGCAVGDGRVYLATLDCHLIAIDARTGKLAWDTQVDDYTRGYSLTVAPQIAGEKVIVGASGGDYGVRGFIDAYNAADGKRIWRFYTIPGPGEPGHESWQADSWKTGGGPSWMAASYDSESNTIYAGIGNPGPDLQGQNRTGDNLYTECTVALDADTGNIKWHYQCVPHDLWDLDNVSEQVLDTITLDGKQRKVVMWACKNGYFYVVDAANGEFIYALQFVHKLNWGKVLDNGSVELDQSKFPAKDKWVTVYPGAAGGKEWCPVAYDPKRKRIFVPVVENGHRHKVIRQEFKPGLLYWGGISSPVPGEAYGHVAAIDVENRKIAWDVRTKQPVVSGIACTASGLVITGTPDQKMLVLNADDGKILHTFKAVSGWHSAPVTYAVGGTQFIAFANGWGGWVAGYDDVGTPDLRDLPPLNTLYVFSLPTR